MKEYEYYMRKALELAVKGIRKVAPNPMVGCVIVHGDTIIGKGYHEYYGNHHAEVNAFESVEEKSLIKESTLYVSLEPCCHHGQTPPCTDRIIAEGIKKVVIGCSDVFSKVNGKGIKQLRAAGIEVVVDVIPDQCRMLNKRFFTFHSKKRPYIILKWAQSKDGLIDKMRESDDQNPHSITGDMSNDMVHQWRSSEQAILVGTKTAALDNPKLTVRRNQGLNPTRIVIDRIRKLPTSLNLFDKTVPTIVFAAEDDVDQENIAVKKIDFNQDVVSQILDNLYSLNILSVIIEGGADTLDAFIEKDLWDEARIFQSTEELYAGVPAPVLSKGTVKLEQFLEGDQLIIIQR